MEYECIRHRDTQRHTERATRREREREREGGREGEREREQSCTEWVQQSIVDIAPAQLAQRGGEHSAEIVRRRPAESEASRDDCAAREARSGPDLCRVSE